MTTINTTTSLLPRESSHGCKRFSDTCPAALAALLVRLPLRRCCCPAAAIVLPLLLPRPCLFLVQLACPAFSYPWISTICGSFSRLCPLIPAALADDTSAQNVCQTSSVVWQRTHHCYTLLYPLFWVRQGRPITTCSRCTAVWGDNRKVAPAARRGQEGASKSGAGANKKQKR